VARDTDAVCLSPGPCFLACAISAAAADASLSRTPNPAAFETVGANWGQIRHFSQYYIGVAYRLGQIPMAVDGEQGSAPDG
jgi:hypothetical protein